MVKAGVYLVARLAPAFATVGVWRPAVIIVGLTTMIAGGLRALRPYDLKQVLAFGTISPLGFMTVLVGLGSPAATAASPRRRRAPGRVPHGHDRATGMTDARRGSALVPRSVNARRARAAADRILFVSRGTFAGFWARRLEPAVGPARWRV